MKTILVIEDQDPIRANIAVMLNRSGFRAVEAANGRVGVELARAYLPDLIVCDITMPDLDGYGVLTKLQQEPETATIPFIFLSAKANRSDIREGMNLGADDYLTKPFTRDELIGAVNSRLEKQAAITQPYLAEMKRAAENLNKIAYCDPLTNLPNRILLRQKLQETIGHALQTQQRAALVYLSLNRFSNINNTLGYTTGDMILKLVGERLQQSVGDRSTVARLSGVEFCVLVEQAGSDDEIAHLATSLLNTVSEPFLLEEQNVCLQASIGIVRFPEDGSDPDALLSHADLARRFQEQNGGHGFQFYRSSMEVVDAERRSLEVDLTEALSKSEFELYYQPQVNLITGRVIGVEALLRWQHPKRGMVSPAVFVPLAEATDLIVPLGEWVLRMACRQAQLWQSASLLPLRISINLSARQFRQETLVESIKQTLQEARLNPRLLVLELTETSLIDDVETTIATLQELKAMGVSIAIDDFGTGYSSLSYLRRFPIDALKIDRSFVSQVPDNTHDAAIVKAVIALAQSLKLKVIAEGVETHEQLNFLRQNGCHAMQGYLYSRPLPTNAVQELLKEDRRLVVAPS
ncbi:MAG TPA: EAL domain-containing protein [Synechococcales cyanobacterium M55_K2018_004]|nr:EAL domain-containing protein [Synechococcales cyanobacterium M55_K2018_004]